MIGILVLAACVAWGTWVLRLCGVPLRTEERWVVGSMLGLAGGGWLLYVLAASAGGLSAWTLTGFAALAGLTGWAASTRPLAHREPVERWFLTLALGLGVALTVMNLWGVVAPSGDGFVAQEHVWADTPFHLSIINSFAHRENYPPVYHVALGEQLGYPFVVNYLSAILVRYGLGIRAGLIVVNVAVQLGFFCAVALLTVRLTGSRRAGVIAAGVLFALGNLGFLAIPGDIAAAGGVGAWISDLPWSYTGGALGEEGRERFGTGLYLGSPTFIFFLPRRSGAFGLAVGAALLIVLHELVRRRRAGTAVVTGLMIGLLPRVHGHSLLAVVIVALTWAALIPVWEGRASRDGWIRPWREAVGPWLLAGTVALGVGLPQLAGIGGQASGFLSWWVGWIGEPNSAAQRLAEVAGADRVGAALGFLWALGWFWVLNAGVLLLLAVLAWRRADAQLRLFYAPFVVLWVFANLVRTQPWEWDNNNFFVYWQMATVILVAPWLASLWPSEEASELVRRSRAALAGVLLVSLTLGGVLSFLYAAQTRHHLWTRQEAAFVAEVRRHVAADEPVLTGSGHTHPVPALSGRQVYTGFPGWLVTHGLDWHTYETRLTEMLSGDVELMRDLGIRYVVIGPWELGYLAERGLTLPEVFDDPRVFREVVTAQPGGRDWRLLELRPAARSGS